MVLLITKNKRKSVAIFLLLLAAVICLSYGSWGLWQRYRLTHEPHPVITQKVITYSTTTPSETKPTKACAEYTVADNHPKRIDIPGVEVGGCVTQVGIDQHGAIAVPDNIYTAGWYVNSVLPGQPGLSVIDGHISGEYKVDAIFQHLSQLKNGDTFTVTLGSGKALNYQVYKEQSVPLDQAVGVLLKKDADITSQLNLITCGGQYNQATKLYDHRVIVSAELISK